MSACEADCESASRISIKKRPNVIQNLRDYVNLSYHSERTIAAQIGVGQRSLNGWLVGKIKPNLESLLKINTFLECQAGGTTDGIAPVGYLPIKGNNPYGRRGKRGMETAAQVPNNQAIEALRNMPG